ncbi:probable cytochrome P450 6a13 [Sipha flava]|uniref:Probable cytochrome P450 6a13 n=2 Tax=Sipha flava TaxID=143950 RepID=A0A8B8F6H7_9HEMI|nr:probable cytochrome P450 6a13 [Sipha flava]XP_025406227.1 probable cytochrome P450 6a13 [Sipha flava]
MDVASDRSAIVASSWSLDPVLGWTVVAALTVFVLLYRFSTSGHDRWRTANVPHDRPMPLFGNTFRMFTGLEYPVDFFDRVYKRFAGEKVCGLYQMTTPFLMVRDPELISRITVRDFGHFTDHGLDTDPEINVLASSLFFLNGHRWKNMRQKLSPGFTTGRLKDAHDRIVECVNRLTVTIDQQMSASGGEGIELKKLSAEFSTNVIATCAFGLQLDDTSEFRKYSDKLSELSLQQQLSQMLIMLCPKLVKFFKLKQFPEDTTQFYRAVFTDLIRYRHENNVVGNDVAQTLMQARKELVLDVSDSTEKAKFTEMDIISNAILLFVAGSETVSVTICFLLYELALNKDVQDKVREEIIKVIKKNGGQLSYNCFTDLHYLNMVLEEVSRLYSITLSLFREVTEDYKVPGSSLVIRKGQKIIIPTYSIHHDPKYYPDPFKFDPERFSEEEKSKRPNGTYLPFGDGPRLCLGKRLAELEMKLVLSIILQKFEVMPCEKTEIPLQVKAMAGLFSPKNGLWLCFKPIVVYND